MSNLILRIVSSIVFVGLIIGPLFMGGRIAYSVYALLGLFTVNELVNLANKCGSFSNRVIALLLYVVIVVVAYEYVFEEDNHFRLLSLAFLGLLLFNIYIEIFRRNRLPFESVATTLFAPIFVSISFLGIAYFMVYRTDLPTPYMIISVFTLIWVNDSAAYLIGRKLGKRKLIERLSPGKTMEGSMSGLLFTLLASFGLSYISGMPGWGAMLGFGATMALAGSLGDLFESRIKREAGVKDSGYFLPGHGGFLDRFDAMMLAIPTAILYFEILIPKHQL